MAMRWLLQKNGKKTSVNSVAEGRQGYVSNRLTVNFSEGDEITVCKFVSVQSSLNHPEKKLVSIASERAEFALKKGFTKLFEEHKVAWGQIWKTSDVHIEGDLAAQQGIRFNIFQLNQTYTGKDERL